MQETIFLNILVNTNFICFNRNRRNNWTTTKFRRFRLDFKIDLKRNQAMEDDDDNESVISEHKSSETNAVASKVAILKSSRDSGSSSRRERRRNRRYGYSLLSIAFKIHRTQVKLH